MNMESEILDANNLTDAEIKNIDGRWREFITRPFSSPPTATDIAKYPIIINRRKKKTCSKCNRSIATGKKYCRFHTTPKNW